MINFTNSLSGNCNFVYLKKFKEEVECFLQNQKIDNSNDAVEDLNIKVAEEAYAIFKASSVILIA